MADPVFDDGVAAPDGQEWTILVRPARLPGRGRSVASALLLKGKYEVLVEAWPKPRGHPKWRVEVTQADADDVGPRLASAITSGEWDPGSDPPSIGQAGQ